MNYSALAATARRMLLSFGSVTNVQLRQFTAGDYDPSIGKAVVVSTDTPRAAVVLDFGAGQTRSPAGTLIEGGDKRVLMEVGLVPTLKDTELIASSTYTMVGIGEVNPAGTPVLYDLHVRT